MIFLGTVAYPQFHPDGPNRFLKSEIAERWNGLEWENYTRSLYGYGPNGEQTSHRFEYFEQSSNQWRLENETWQEFDEQGRVTYSLIRLYDWETQRLNYEYETSRSYRGDLLLETISTEKNLQEGSEYKSIWTRTYDDLDRELTGQIITTYNGETSGSRWRNYWLEGNCLGSNATDYLFDGIWSKSDSTVYDGCDYPRGRTTYGFDNGVAEIKFQSKFEKEKENDSESISYYQRYSQHEDWRLMSIRVTKKDDLDRPLKDSYFWVSDSILFTTEYAFYDPMYRYLERSDSVFSWPDSVLLSDTQVKLPSHKLPVLPAVQRSR